MELNDPRCTCAQAWFSVLPPPPCPVHVGRDPFETQPIPVIRFGTCTNCDCKGCSRDDA